MTLVALHLVVALHLLLTGTSPATRTSMRISTTRWQVQGARWVRYRLPPLYSTGARRDSTTSTEAEEAADGGRWLRGLS